jgi:hypothetical protein
MTDEFAAKSDGRERWRHGAAAVVLVGVTLLFFSALFDGRTYSDVSRYQRQVFPWGHPDYLRVDDRLTHIDQAKSYFPWQAFVSRSYREGTVPLWNPYSFAGTPFLAANANNALYPPRIALSATALSPTRVHDVFVVVHMLLAGLAMYALLKYFASSAAAALLGAIAWMASSFMLAWLALEHFVVVAAFLPLAVLLADASMRRASWPAALALGPVLGLLLLGGNILFVELCFVVVGAYATSLAVARFIRRPSSDGGRVTRAAWDDLGRLVVPWLVAIGLSAATLLPTLDLSNSIARSGLTFSELRASALPWSELVRVVIPPNSSAFVPDHENAYHVALYSGPAVAFLAIVGLLSRRPGAWLARVLLVLTLLSALATPVLALPYILVPGFEHLKPVGRVLFLAVFALTLLAAFGLDLVRTTLDGFLGGRRGHRASMLLAIAAIAVTIASLRLYAPEIMHAQAASPEAAYPPTPLVDRLRAKEHGRFLAVGEVLPASTALVYPLRNAVGYESIIPGRVQDFWRVIAGEDVGELSTTRVLSAFEPIPQFGMMRSDLLSRAGVGFVAAPPQGFGPEPSAEDLARLKLVYSGADGRVYKVRDSLPRAYFVRNCVNAEDSRAALFRFQEAAFDPSKAVILESRGGEPAESCGPMSHGGEAVVRIVKDDAHAVTVSVDAPLGGFLVLNDAWDKGWEATVDGVDRDVLPANALFRAVPIAAGRHSVEFEYRPRTYRIGLVVSAGTLLLLLGVLGARTLRRAVRGRASHG